jgi:hypothetical protein
MTSCQLFAAMPSALANEILEYAFAHERPLYRSTLEAVATSRKVRRVFLEHQPRTERNVTVLVSLTRPPLILVANSLLTTWLLKQHRSLVTGFLDGMKIKHDNGAVEDLPSSADDAALQVAVENLLSNHPTGVVAVYLHAFNDMNGAHWPNLDTMLQTDARLQLKREP